MLTRRGLLLGGLAAPAIVRATSLMRISPVRAEFEAMFASTRGSILYRDASAWRTIEPGNPGEILVYDGSQLRWRWVPHDADGTPRVWSALGTSPIYLPG
jgi:hypothetical protein